MIEAGNLFANFAERAMREEVAVLAETAGGRIERIVSTGQASRPDFGTIRPRVGGDALASAKGTLEKSGMAAMGLERLWKDRGGRRADGLS